MNARLEKLMLWLKDQQIDAAFISSPDNVFYLTRFRCEPHERLLGLAVFQEKEPLLICPAMEADDAKNAGWDKEILGYSDTDNPWDLAEERIKARLPRIRSWAVEKDHLNVSRYEELSLRYEDADFVSADNILNELRLVKDEQEIKLIKKACELVDFAVEVGVNELAEGKTELDIIAAIEYEIKKKGAGMSFDPIVLAGANAASPHGIPGLTKIERGQLVLMDLGVIYEGYCSDITRTVAFGDITDEQKNIYETVLKAEEAAVKLTKPGVKARELDQTARNIIQDAGFGKYFTHRLGHGLGISVHEYPSITETNEMELEPGMIFTIEPGIYIPGVAGVRIEDDVLVTEEGVEVLTGYSKSLQIIE
ncbi:M24 family metallopeptidase [Siminovitchia fortis]|uniref:Aminopeptidase P family protein n=1 Tax=Siminovitchia fortis TaxID=254758 RepID=A0A443IKS0_9BACI|nr:Xaa-Pro peptidase family protein [Siminovitchia fortis]RWR05331.1 aminopeptidase P family protein [Siminovitchia fortis]WHY82342.1 Xaa-Pro peptidase family protein [Siminovitchia fortis]